MSEVDGVAAEAEWTSVETSGVTVEEAIAAALAELGAGTADVAVEVLSRPARVLPGERVSAAAEARVRVAKLDENTARARATLAELLERMGIAARIAARRAAATPGGPPAPPSSTCRATTWGCSSDGAGRPSGRFRPSST